MTYVQFRIHPSVGVARYGNSPDVYYVGNDFPQFVQERFPKTRTKPRSRTHPEALSADNWSVEHTKSGTLKSFSIFDPAKGADNKFKDVNKKIKPQAARFRVFAYVYDKEKSLHPCKVFEIDADTADITWKVTLANQKSVIDANDTDFEIEHTLNTKQSQANILEAKRFKNASSMTLGYAMLERASNDQAKITGRLHIVGSDGMCRHKDNPQPVDPKLRSLWNNDWLDSGSDGPVTAKVKIKALSAFKASIGVNQNADLKYLDADAVAPVDANANTQVSSVSAWCVVGPPDYSPDMGHFVSVWDLGLDASMQSASNKFAQKQPKIHKQITTKTRSDTYKDMDYFVHIHPQLCLFCDVNEVSSVANGSPQSPLDKPSIPMPGHNHDEEVAGAKVEPKVRRGLSMDPRDLAQRAEFESPSGQKGETTSAINKRKKAAIFSRLRKPGTLYQYFDSSKRMFVTKTTTKDPLTNGVAVRTPSTFPRPVGRRVGYTGPGTADDPYTFPPYDSQVKHLRTAYSNDDIDIKAQFKRLAGKGCGKSTKEKITGREPGQLAINDTFPTSNRLNTSDPHDTLTVDDMFWPATPTDMPLLLELAYTHLQYEHFKTWQAAGTPANTIFPAIFPRGKDRRGANALNHIMLTGSDDPDVKYDELVSKSPKYAPALIDMAYMGSMLGGSFLPGIEVGREAGVALNWVLMEGATGDFPDVRFKPATNPQAHIAGKLTKDLAMPWSKDFIACDEAFWPTARPGYVSEVDKNGDLKDTVEWPVSGGDWVRPNATTHYYNDYWTRLGFVRRQAPTLGAEDQQPDFINEEAERSPEMP